MSNKLCIYCNINKREGSRRLCLDCISKDDNIKWFLKFYKNNEKYKDLKSDIDYTTCNLCGYRAEDLCTHLRRSHNITSPTINYDGELFSQKRKKINSDRMKGDKNPWFNHNGKYSPFSKDFISYEKLSEDEKKEEIKGVREKQSKSCKENGNFDSTLIYWLKRGYSEEEAKKHQSERQATFTLEKCIERHGVEEGTRIYNDRQARWQASLYNNKSKEWIEDFHKRRIKNTSGYSVSNAENEILEYIQSNSDIEVESQFALSGDNSRVKLYDIRYKNKIIEYNGDFWHMNPKFNSPDSYNSRTKRSAAEQWNLDKEKIELANINDFEVLVIWEDDFNTNKEEVLKQCLNFLIK